MGQAYDYFGHEYESDIPAFVEVDDKHLLHRLTHSFYDKPALLARWASESYTPGPKEVGPAADWLWEHYTIGAPGSGGGGGGVNTPLVEGPFDATDWNKLPVGGTMVELTRYQSWADGRPTYNFLFHKPPGPPDANGEYDFLMYEDGALVNTFKWHPEQSDDFPYSGIYTSDKPAASKVTFTTNNGDVTKFDVKFPTFTGPNEFLPPLPEYAEPTITIAGIGTSVATITFTLPPGKVCAKGSINADLFAVDASNRDIDSRSEPLTNPSHMIGYYGDPSDPTSAPIEGLTANQLAALWNYAGTMPHTGSDSDITVRSSGNVVTITELGGKKITTLQVNWTKAA